MTLQDLYVYVGNYMELQDTVTSSTVANVLTGFMEYCATQLDSELAHAKEQLETLRRIQTRDAAEINRLTALAEQRRKDIETLNAEVYRLEDLLLKEDEHYGAVIDRR